MYKNTQLLLTLLISSSLTLSAVAQQFIFPKNGQSAEQQQKDEFSCHSWAVSQTGVDPTQVQVAAGSATPSVEQGAKTSSGSVVRGAAAGAIIAEIGDNDAGNGAAKGAAIGLLAKRRHNRKAAEHAQEQQHAAQEQAEQTQQATNEQIENYNKAKNVCLDAKGYSISK